MHNIRLTLSWLLFASYLCILFIYIFCLYFIISHQAMGYICYPTFLRENRMVDRWLLNLWPQPYHLIPQVEGDAAGLTMRAIVLMHLSTIRFSCYAIVLLKTNYIMCYNVNYFVFQSVGLDFTSGSAFCQWVWIASGSGYENPMGQTPCSVTWSTHNHGIMACPYIKYNGIDL